MRFNQIHRLIVPGFFVIMFFAMASFANDIDTLQDRLAAFYLKGGAGGAAGFLSLQRVDGSWPDINYADRGGSIWAPGQHLNRLLSMAIAFNLVSNPSSRDTAMLGGIIRGLDYWYINDAVIYSDNWWYNDIGQQMSLGPILILMEKDLDSARVQRGSNFLNNPGGTGQNLVWIASETVWRGCLRESLSDINWGLDAIQNELRIITTPDDGIQPDFSFFQHGTLLYNGGYGWGFMDDITSWALMAQGLSFAFDTGKMNILTGLILDGSQWMIRRNYFDFACSGREISRPGWGKLSNRQGLMDNLPKIHSGRHAELQAFVDHVNGINDSALTGDKHFWRSDYHVLRAKNFFFSIRAWSNRTSGTEFMNSENLKGNYLPFGATTILRRGDEYFGIYPVWDWCHLPGVTCLQGHSWSFTPRDPFVGGVSDGKHGAVGFKVNQFEISGCKAWFCFGNEVVALGTGFSVNGGSGWLSVPMYTSINQCWLTGSVWTANDSGTGAVIARGMRKLDNTRWVFHDSVGYVFPNPTPVTLKNETQSGSWYSINANYTNDVVSGDVFSLWIDYGLSPANAVYEYIVVPGKSKTDIQEYAQRIPVHTLSNTTDIQAVRHDSLGVTGIVFYKAGRMIVRLGLAVEVDQPCIVLIDESDPNYRVSVCNPVNTALTVNVNLLFINGGKELMVFSLPGGGDAGKSVTKTSVSPVVTVMDSTPPTNVIVNSVVVNDQTITLSWNAAADAESGIESYQIYRGATENPTELVATVGNVLTYQDETGMENTTFHYRIKAINGVYLSSIAFSNDVSATTARDTVRPCVTAIQASPASVRITFSKKIEQASAENIGNYAIDQGIQVSAATLQADQKTVVLSVSPVITGTTYFLDVSGIRDQASIPNTMNALNISFTPQVPALYHWQLDEAIGLTASDATGHGNTATLSGAPAWSAGKYGNALTFDGVDDYLSTSLLQTNPNVFTLSLWFKTTSTTGGKLIGFGDAQTGTSGHYDRHLYMSNDGKVYFGCYNGSVQTINTTIACNDNAWHYAAVTLSGAGIMLYIDGALIASNTSVTSGENYSGYWRMGFDDVTGWPSAPSSNFFNGQLDDIRVYDKVLSASDIALLYDNGTENEPVIITPENLVLEASPNPINPSVRINYYLPQKSARYVDTLQSAGEACQGTG